MKKILIIGGGAMGSAFTIPCLDNKNSVTSSEESIRASYGFGFSYYSPIGPIGFTWGFPLADEDYDIKRMFLFTIGNLN